MQRWSHLQVFRLLLGVFVALGMSLSAIQAGSMAAKMAAMPDMATSGQGDCGGCGMGADAAAKALACASICMAPALAVLPQGVTVAMIETTAPDLYPRRDVLLHGRAHPPDPYPPRPINLG